MQICDLDERSKLVYSNVLLELAPANGRYMHKTESTVKIIFTCSGGPAKLAMKEDQNLEQNAGLTEKQDENRGNRDGT